MRNPFRRFSGEARVIRLAVIVQYRISLIRTHFMAAAWPAHGGWPRHTSQTKGKHTRRIAKKRY